MGWHAGMGGTTENPVIAGEAGIHMGFNSENDTLLHNICSVIVCPVILIFPLALACEECSTFDHVVAATASGIALAILIVVCVSRFRQNREHSFQVLAEPANQLELFNRASQGTPQV